jgi:hypothetical protein
VARHAYWLLLGLVLASAIFQVAAGETDGVRLVTIMLQSATLTVAVWTARTKRRIAHLAVIVALGATLVAAIVLAVHGEVPRGLASIVNGLLVALAPALIASTVIGELLEERVVTLRTLSGVLAIYLLIGMFFSFMYGAVDALGSGPFFAQIDHATRSDYLYFSYITQTTVGYGDLTAATDVGRMLAVVEALFGQIYLVTVVALIIGNLGRGAVGRESG